MTHQVPVFHTVAALRAQVATWKKAGEKVALVPTMGALHAGHVSLVEAARARASRVVVSIFVNPTQFAPTEDFGAYPRTLEADLARLAVVQADGAFAPSVAEMYHKHAATTVTLQGPAAAGLEDRFRPTHFAGVATVVAKLLNQAQADVALFGEKDYQQLKVIARMAEDLDIPTRILGCPTVREADGLALSSRNVYLSKEERARAPALHRAMCGAAEAISQGAPVAGPIAHAVAEVTRAGFVVDYIEARHAVTLAPIVSAAEGPVRILAAARLGKTRLIDNISA
jgi:pantoate--beta-alanine ligase